VVTASHCHAVPCDDVLERTFDALKQAAAGLEPVHVGAGRVQEHRVSENRRVRVRSGGDADSRQLYALPADGPGRLGAVKRP
jgi:hypothetical protein